MSTTIQSSRSSLPIPPSIPSLLHIDILLLHRLRLKNAAQHRSGLFFRRVAEVERLGRRVQEALKSVSEDWTEDRQAQLRKEVRRLKLLVDKTIPALTKATSSVNKMISHLHFIPLTSILLGIYARMWCLCLDLRLIVKSWEERSMVDPEGGNGKVGADKWRMKEMTEEEVICAGSVGVGKNATASTEGQGQAEDPGLGSGNQGKGKELRKRRRRGDVNLEEGGGSVVSDAPQGGLNLGIEVEMNMDLGTAISRNSLDVGLRPTSPSSSTLSSSARIPNHTRTRPMTGTTSLITASTYINPSGTIAFPPPRSSPSRRNDGEQVHTRSPHEDVVLAVPRPIDVDDIATTSTSLLRKANDGDGREPRGDEDVRHGDLQGSDGICQLGGMSNNRGKKAKSGVPAPSPSASGTTDTFAASTAKRCRSTHDIDMDGIFGPDSVIRVGTADKREVKRSRVKSDKPEKKKKIGQGKDGTAMQEIGDLAGGETRGKEAIHGEEKPRERRDEGIRGRSDVDVDMDKSRTSVSAQERPLPSVDEGQEIRQVRSTPPPTKTTSRKQVNKIGKKSKSKSLMDDIFGGL